MNILQNIRNGEDGILVSGNHPSIVQSILDFDFLVGKKEPSVVGILTATKKTQKFFFGRKELLIPCFKDLHEIPTALGSRIRWLLNLQSGRRAFDTTVHFLTIYPDALGAHLFAENVPEQHATELIRRYGNKYLIVGPSGVGLLVPGYIKLGAIGGTQPAQLLQGKSTQPGSVAILSTSGGMTNEIITAAATMGVGTSFALCIGGDRFSGLSLADACKMAEADVETHAIAYFGELGGVDEYEIASLLHKKEITKPIVAYIAGIIDEAFIEPMQFGHAKALVAHKEESARAKRLALSQAGVKVAETFPELIELLASLPHHEFRDTVLVTEPLMNRTQSILSTREITDTESVPVFIKDGALVLREPNAFASLALHALLGRSTGPITSAFVENIFELLVDHGGHVSGAVNTMITARAGKDLISSLAAGLLTIGPRFGGAVNDAAICWIQGVSESPADFVEIKAKRGELISGIGHRVYRAGLPDPRVAALAEFAGLIKKHPYYDFARNVERVTTSKNGSLILNIDGVIAALLLDLLGECEGFSQEELKELASIEFFNAMFVIPRSIGFIAHFMEQKKNDEGLFRLPEELLFVRKKD